jgi:hypothetical protein
MADDTGRAQMTGEGKFGARADILTGPMTWSYFYVLFGFALSIEGTLIQMIPLQFPWNIVTFVVISGITCYLVLFSGSCRDKIVELKGWIENKHR